MARLARSLPWVTGMPLGKEVEPEENWTNATSSSAGIRSCVFAGDVVRCAGIEGSRNGEHGMVSSAGSETDGVARIRSARYLWEMRPRNWVYGSRGVLAWTGLTDSG